MFFCEFEFLSKYQFLYNHKLLNKKQFFSEWHSTMFFQKTSNKYQHSIVPACQGILIRLDDQSLGTCGFPWYPLQKVITTPVGSSNWFWNAWFQMEWKTKRSVFSWNQCKISKFEYKSKYGWFEISPIGISSQFP